VACAALRPGYGHLANVISELGASGTPNASFMNYAGFVPCGLMLAVFAVALRRALPRRRLTHTAAALLMLFALGFMASGVFSCDPGCPQTGGSREHVLHDRIAPVMFLCGIVATAVFGHLFRGLPTWRHLATPSLVTSVVALALMIALIGSLDSRTLSGLWQRLMIAVLFFWCAAVGLAAYRSAGVPVGPTSGRGGDATPPRPVATIT
jgi:hypothetical membrane protein